MGYIDYCVCVNYCTVLRMLLHIYVINISAQSQLGL